MTSLQVCSSPVLVDGTVRCRYQLGRRAAMRHVGVLRIKHMRPRADSEKNSDHAPAEGVQPRPPTTAPQQPPQDPERNLKLPKEDLDIIRERVFGLDNFYVRSLTNTEAGATFMGNVRGRDPKIAYDKARQRLQDAFGDKYTLVLSRMDEVNTAIILPTYAVVDSNLSPTNESLRAGIVDDIFWGFFERFSTRPCKIFSLFPEHCTAPRLFQIVFDGHHLPPFRMVVYPYFEFAPEGFVDSADVILEVEGQRLPAHSQFLASQSRFMDNMVKDLGGNFSRSEQIIVPASMLSNYKAQDVQAFLCQAVVALICLAATIVTVLGANGVPTESFIQASRGDFSNSNQVAAALPGAIAFLSALGAHELGHWFVAKQSGDQLGLPLLFPSPLGTLGSFGSITRIKAPVASRGALCMLAAWGPLAGAAVSFAFVLLGLGLTVAGQGSTEVQTSAFEDSFLVGGLGQLLLGSELAAKDSVQVHPVLVAGWSALIVNCLNAIPIGELDGGRVAFAIWGPRTAQRITAALFILLGICSTFDALSLWFLVGVVPGLVHATTNASSHPSAMPLP
ncbi:hypothetical protein WJX84_008175 [Apatococcus fuscideae]|uniref:BTB domain-containing protein n=1 Tax=Apatococcus fuscideae TaxID=2026836 RepID=A0AAW1TAS5_9CHLO